MYEVNMKNYKIGLLKGDGIGPEIVESAVRVLEAVGKKRGIGFTFTPYLIGGAAIDACGAPLPQETVDGCLASDSVLLGAVATRKEARGNGYASKAVKALANRLNDKSVFLFCRNDSLLAFYEKIGFVYSGKWAELRR